MPMARNAVYYFRRPPIEGRQIAIRYVLSARQVSSTFSPLTRTIKFKIPLNEKHSNIEISLLDRASTWNMVKSFLSHDTKQIEPANEHEGHVLSAFGLQPDSLLNIPPLKSLPTPFKYHSLVNGDRSYIRQPRLSVSKLLTNAWCELKSFYEVYAGLPRMSPLASMKAGTKYHAKLEHEEHPRRDEISLKTQIRFLLANHLKDAISELVRTKDAAEFAQNWIEQTVFRSICASRTKVARELFVHGFLDMASERLVTQEDELSRGVLVNGIADIVKIDTFNASESFDDAASRPVDSVSEVLPNFGRSEVLDLTAELAKSKNIMTELAKDNYLHMRDMKTRRLNSLPSQRLALNGAKMQCMYYAAFLYNLSRGADFAYESCIENIKRREIHPDEPISIALTTELLVVNFRVIAVDFVRLAQGDSIGFPRFDQHLHEEREYSLSQFLSEDELRQLMHIHYGDELDISGFDLSPLFKTWRIPLTLRYICARAGQAFNIYEAFKPSSVCVEYHNPQSHEIIARIHHPFNEREMEEAIIQTSQFWNGQRRPIHTDDPSVCSYCTFKKRCSAINSGMGPEAARLIQDLQH